MYLWGDTIQPIQRPYCVGLGPPAPDKSVILDFNARSSGGGWDRNALLEKDRCDPAAQLSSDGLGCWDGSDPGCQSIW